MNTEDQIVAFLNSNLADIPRLHLERLVRRLCKLRLAESESLSLKGFIKVTVSASGDQEIFPLNTIAIFRDQGLVLNTGKVYQVKESLKELEKIIKEAL
jgi:hypothetical protein